jgi:hypothetical protein
MTPALALSIDADGCTVDRLRRVLGYWAGREATELGPGLGLPVASSMFAVSANPAAPPQAAYLDGDRDGLLDAYRRGWIDTLHSIGDFAADRPCTRDLAKRAFDALAADGVRLRVWTNHGGPENAQNFRKAGGTGDVPGSPAYLADLAADYGIRYAWLSALTPVVGQDRAASASEYYAGFPEAPGWKRFAASAFGGGVARRLGLEPYAGNRLVEPATLADGRPILAFRRYGRWRVDTVAQLPRILAPAVLDRLQAVGGRMVVYLHIGPSADETPATFRDGLRTLDAVAARVKAGTLRVLRTVDLLDEASVDVPIGLERQH